MKKVQETILKKIAAISKFIAVKAAGTVSCAGYYQPKEPETLKMLKR